jgi:hypothetical protein
MATTNTTIRIAETVHPLRESRSRTQRVSTGVDDGIYNIRALSRGSSRERSRDAWSVKPGEEAEDDDPGLRRTGDYKTKQVLHAPLIPRLL